MYERENILKEKIYKGKYIKEENLYLDLVYFQYQRIKKGTEDR